MNIPIRKGSFNRYFLFHPQDPRLAWSGTRWVPCWDDGFPAGGVQTCNFPSPGEAEKYLKATPAVVASLKKEDV